jgi:hypothetical protein
MNDEVESGRADGQDVAPDGCPAQFCPTLPELGEVLLALGPEFLELRFVYRVCSIR